MKLEDMTGTIYWLVIAILIGLPLSVCHWILRPRAMLEWYRQGCGYPSPIEIEQRMKSEENE